MKLLPTVALVLSTIAGCLCLQSVAHGQLTADEIPTAHTPPGGYGDVVPPPILAECTEPLVPGAPDLRGIWEVVCQLDGTEHPSAGALHRIEQCGDRIVITASGVIHDSRADGTIENGVHDVAASDFTTPIHVVSSYEDFVHVLRPVGTPIEVTRMLDGDQLLWEHFATSARMDFVAPVPEPSSGLLLTYGLGLMGLLLRRRGTR